MVGPHTENASDYSKILSDSFRAGHMFGIGQWTSTVGWRTEDVSSCGQNLRHFVWLRFFYNCKKKDYVDKVHVTKFVCGKI